MTSHSDVEVVVLDRDQADDLARLLGLLEDWLLHADDATRRDLEAFWPYPALRDPVGRIITALAANTRLLRHTTTSTTPR